MKQNAVVVPVKSLGTTSFSSGSLQFALMVMNIQIFLLFGLFGWVFVWFFFPIWPNSMLLRSYALG